MTKEGFWNSKCLFPTENWQKRKGKHFGELENRRCCNGSEKSVSSFGLEAFSFLIHKVSEQIQKGRIPGYNIGNHKKWHYAKNK